MRTSTSERPARGETLRQLIAREAERAGFDSVAVTSPDAIPLAPSRLRQFVAEGFHGSMDWIAETLERVCIKTVESGKMTKDLALLIGPDQSWMTTEQFFEAIVENLEKEMANWA